MPKTAVSNTIQNNIDSTFPSNPSKQNPHPNAITLYQTHQIHKTETQITHVKEWTQHELCHYITTQTSLTTKNNNKYADIIQKILTVIEKEDISGDLLLAGGSSYLIEKAHHFVFNKRDRNRLRFAVDIIFDSIQDALDLRGNVSYWDRIYRCSALGNALCEEYDNDDGGEDDDDDDEVGARLRLALEPRSLDDVLYVSLCHLEVANDVLEADCYVGKDVLEEEDCYLFKVVCVSPRDDPDVVWSNLIYVRSDAALVSSSSSSSPKKKGEDLSEDVTTHDDTMDDKTRRRQEKRRNRLLKKKKRRAAKRKRSWELLASVDFAQHGSAPPGHWHLNRTSCGGILPHLSISFGGANEESGDEVWHGKEDCCPLWWQFIPEGMVHKSVPQRLKSLVEREIES